MEEQSEHGNIISQTLWSEHNARSGDKSVSWSLPSETCLPSNSAEKLEELSTISYSESNSSISNQLSEDSRQKSGMYDLNQNSLKEATSKGSLKSADSRKPSSSTVSSEEGSSSLIASGAACVVCGDKASGKHYGQITCEGCKSFFKRSVRRNMNYTCRGSRDCAIDPQHRNQCQYCRLRKCVKAGMRKEAVQRGRVTQNIPLEYSACHIPHLSAANGLVDPNQPRILPPSYVNNMLSVLVRAEPFGNHSGSSPFQMSGASNSEMDTVCEVSRQVLYSVMEWARRIPYFTDISAHDQDVLIRNSWAELFILSFIQWCPTVYARSIIGAVTRYASEHNIDHDGMSQLLQQIEKLYSLQVDRAECSALKALALFNPDCLSLSDLHSIGGLQDRALASLEEYDKVYYTNYPNRFGKLLMRLAILKTTKSTVIDQAFFASADMKGSPVGIMLRDMYALSNSMCWPQQTGDPGLTPSHASAH